MAMVRCRVMWAVNGPPGKGAFMAYATVAHPTVKEASRSGGQVSPRRRSRVAAAR